MNLRQNESSQTVLAPAKLNLFLDILGRRSDGFHELETLLVPLRLYDSISMRATRPLAEGRPGSIELRVVDARGGGEANVAGEPIPLDSNNLVVRALELLRSRSGCGKGAQVLLVKRIPLAAGLGGGSSDAAAMLRLANVAWDICWPVERLAPLAAELGSDVPFFLYDQAAICRGRGELVEPLAATRRLHFVVVKPPAELSTGAVYREFDAHSSNREHQPGAVAALAAAMARGNLFEVARRIGNQLEAAAARLSPWVSRLRSAFAELDFVAHQLTGSGTGYFGVCRHAAHARRLATTLRTRQLGLVYVTRSCC